jgi:hypothetical protein
MNNVQRQNKSSHDNSRNEKSNGEGEDDAKLWTTEAVIDKLELQLCSIIDGENNKKYEKQAQKLIHKIPIYRDLAFVIAHNDLSPRLLRELASYDETSQQTILKAAVGRIFEAIDPRYFKQSVEKLLMVEVRDQ